MSTHGRTKLNAVMPLPFVTPGTAPFWEGGAQGKLLISRCSNCSWWIHPPGPICPNCRSRDVLPTPASGKGAVYSYTIAVHQFHPAFPTPYVLGVVTLEEQDNLRIYGILRDVPPDDVYIGLPVQIAFRRVDRIYLMEFLPAGRVSA